MRLCSIFIAGKKTNISEPNNHTNDEHSPLQQLFHKFVTQGYCCKCNVFLEFIINAILIIRCYKFLLHLFINNKMAFIGFPNYRPIHTISAYH